MSKVEIFDSTLRDGSQGEGISFSVSDKLKLVKLLDEMHIDYIEAGNPGSNPKDILLFNELKNVNLKNSKLVAFGSTRRYNTKSEDDPNLKAIVDCGVDTICIFGKSWDFHVTDIIHTNLDANLEMIKDTIRFLTNQNKQVFFDAEHFFDGYKSNKEYAIKTLDAAIEGGAVKLVLCETRGGALPSEIKEITKEIVERYKEITIGIHTHNDGGVAVASSLLAYEAGARHIQGTMLGFGERCGNANLVETVCNLKFKMGVDCLEDSVFENLSTIAHEISEISNVRIPKLSPFVGRSSFAHKGGMHIDGVKKNPISFEHMDPSLIGNRRRLLTSEVAGKALLIEKIKRLYPDFNPKDKRVYDLVNKLKELEACGYQFEGAEASFDLLIKRCLESKKSYFELSHYQTIGKQYNEVELHTAMIKVEVAGESAITAAEGAGPVNALDKALRKVLDPFYPILRDVYLSDYKVRVLDSLDQATASVVRVLIESTDGKKTWNTVGVDHDIIAASWQALSDSIAWYLEDSGVEPAK